MQHNPLEYEVPPTARKRSLVWVLILAAIILALWIGNAVWFAWSMRDFH